MGCGLGDMKRLAREARIYGRWVGVFVDGSSFMVLCWVVLNSLGLGERIYGVWFGGYEETGYRGEDIWAVVGWI
jgi:hypothetical protein